MAVTSLTVDYDEINSSLAMLLHYSRTLADWTADELADAARIRRRGLSVFYNPPKVQGMAEAHRWSFLRPELTIATSIPYSTGTVTIASGVVTLAGGTFPTWAASGWLYIGGVPYVVAVRTDGTHVTLQDTSINKAAGTTYTLRQYKYAMPTGFGGLVGPLFYAPHQSTRQTQVKHASEQMLRRYFQDQFWGDSGYPSRYSILTDAHSATAGQTWSMILWPSAQAVYYVTGNYHFIPPDLDATNKYPAGGPVHGQTVLEAILAEAELALRGEYGPHRERFLECLVTSISHDKRMTSPDTLGTIPSDEFTEVGSGCVADQWLVHEGFESSILP